MSEEDINMLQYFWNEKGDPKRWCGYKKWSDGNPGVASELERLISDWEWAEKRITLYIDSLV